MRFNDLDNIGITGRHYSGFIMLGIQVFNYPNDYKFFKDECIEFNFRWLTETLGIDPKEHKPLSAMKVRQWVSQLLSRSILLGSSADGVSMHDVSGYMYT